jgi:hypothetical protein
MAGINVSGLSAANGYAAPQTPSPLMAPTNVVAPQGQSYQDMMAKPMPVTPPVTESKGMGGK